MAKFTVEAFVEKAKNSHGNRYDYSKVTTRDEKGRVTIVCKEHGEFNQNYSNHQNGAGCPSCKAVTIGNNKRSSKQDWITNCNSLHANKYDYSNVDYKNNRTKVEIVCPEHGSFYQTPGHHLAGHGCSVCSSNENGKLKRISTQDFIDRSNEVHSGKYSYHKTLYDINRNKVVITCNLHGDFEQSPKAHLIGVGCPACNSTGFVSNKSANFYIATNGYFTKVGITNKHPNIRLANVSKSAKSDFKLIEYFNFEDGSQALALETLMLKNLRASYEQCPTWFDGSSECFIDVPLDFISDSVGKFLLTL